MFNIRQLILIGCIVLCLYDFFVLAGSVLLLFILSLLILDLLHWPSWYKPPVGTTHYRVSPVPTKTGFWRIDITQWTGTNWIFIGTETSIGPGSFKVPCIIDYGYLEETNNEKGNDKGRKDQQAPGS